jgi:hypothetical protein
MDFIIDYHHFAENKNPISAKMRRGSVQFLRSQKWGTGRRKKFGVKAEVTKR